MLDPLSDLTPLFKRAFEIADAFEYGPGILIRAHIARLAQQAGLAGKLSDHISNAIAAADELEKRLNPPELLREAEELDNLERLAKRLLLEGDEQSAEATFLLGEDFRSEDEKNGTHVTFLTWLLEADHLTRSVKFFHDKHWGGPGMQVFTARRIAHALDKAGRRPEGLDLLRSLWRRGASNEQDMLALLGKELWDIGERSEGAAFLREAARLSLVNAAHDPEAQLWGFIGEPLTVAKLQCEMSDRDGAIETLNGVMRLAAPFKYTLSQHPQNATAETIFVAGPTFRPTSQRWLSALPDLVGLLARLNLDSDAFALADTDSEQRFALLGNIAKGQAHRGAYSEAFKTVKIIENIDLFEPEETHSITFKPDGSIVVDEEPSLPSMTSLERKAAMRGGLQAIIREATTASDDETVRSAKKLLQHLDPHRNPPIPEWNSSPIDALLSRGEFDQALAAVAATSLLDHRLVALRHVMDRVVENLKPLAAP